MDMHCELCDHAGGEILWEDQSCRVVWVDEPDYPGFCRVILKAHIKEMTDLSPDARSHLMQVVFAVEQAIRQEMSPDKVNLASLGNAVPHLHWHVIPRFIKDKHFPSAIWANPHHEGPPQAFPNLQQRLQTTLCHLCSNLI